MVKFKYNVLKTDELCNTFINQVNKYADLNEKIYMNIKYSKNVWNDPASVSFSDIVIKDERVCKDIKSNIEKYVGCISFFSNGLRKIFLNKGIILDKFELKYDGDCVDSCMVKLTEINDILNSCVNEFNAITYPLDFEYYDEINSLSSSILNLKNKTNCIVNDVDYINKKINSLIRDTENHKKKIDIILCDKKVVRLESSIIPLDSVK